MKRRATVYPTKPGAAELRESAAGAWVKQMENSVRSLESGSALVSFCCSRSVGLSIPISLKLAPRSLGHAPLAKHAL